MRPWSKKIWLARKKLARKNALAYTLAKQAYVFVLGKLYSSKLSPEAYP
jgi:hypothetical protein